jgi:hypothetical protein
VAKAAEAAGKRKVARVLRDAQARQGKVFSALVDTSIALNR